MVRPTDEQVAAVEKFQTGNPLKIAAFAGAGKTTTLKMLAEATRSRGIYLAFNRSIANDAKEKFPRSVDCRTTHAIAFRAVMPRYGSAAKMTKNLHARQLASALEYTDRIFPGSLRLNGVHQAHLVLGTIKGFCQSADSAIGLAHVPRYGRLLGAKEEVVRDIREWAVAEASALWGRMVARGDETPLGHDGYLKLWALDRPRLSADYILLDEAQDTNPVVLGVLADQPGQVVYVGDRHQQIYEWRGAVNAMEKIAGCDEAALTQSFRFGADIAAAASRVLTTLGEARQIRGNPAVASGIAASGRADAVLARTNATVILEVLEATRANQRPYVCGGTQELKRLLSDVYELKAGKPALSPEFFGFQAWADVVDFADAEEGQGIRTFVQMVEQHGEAKLWSAVTKAVAEEEGADIILSTAHKAKGREWNAVRLASDFLNAKTGSANDAESEVRLFYVAMTRAKKQLICEPELLRNFTTDAWKTRPAASPRSYASTARQLPVPDQRNIREVNPAARRMQRPAAAAPPSASTRPTVSARPAPLSVTPPRPAIRELTSPAAALRHPGAVFHPSPMEIPPSAIVTTAPERKTFWKRVARLFGA